MCARVAPRARLEPNLAPAFDDANHHDVRDAYAADEQRDSAQPDKQGGKRRVSGHLCFERVAWAGHLDLLGVLGICGGAKHATDVLDELGDGRDVDGRRRDVGLEVGLCRGDPMITERSRSAASGNASRTPITVKRWPPTSTCCPA